MRLFCDCICPSAKQQFAHWPAVIFIVILLTMSQQINFQHLCFCFLYLNIFSLFFLRSCDPSICWTHSIFSSLRNTKVNTCLHKHSLSGGDAWIRHLHWFYEQYGSLQFWARSKMALWHLSPSQVSHVHSIVSIYNGIYIYFTNMDYVFFLV